MHCPSCEKQLDWDWIKDECIEPNKEFECPHCTKQLQYSIDDVYITVLNTKPLKLWMMEQNHD